GTTLTDPDPETHVENIRDPLCIIHGKNDPRCPISQARQFRDALEDVGLDEGQDADFEYYELDEEGHGSTDVEDRVRVIGMVSDFLDRRL
ncbi:MAG: alpha/beta hydrolase family protein, partial [Halobacteriaceae archaeon]